MKNNDAARPFNVKYYCWGAVLLWTGFLFAWLSRYPNPLTALILDQWKIILPFVSMMVVAFAFCRKFQWWTVKVSLIIVCVLFLIAVLNFSLWMPIFIQNNTSIPLQAVMTDLSNNRVRIVSVPSGQIKCIELLKSENGTFGDTQWHLLVYDKTGSVYLQQMIKGSEIERRHTVYVHPKTSEE